MWNEHIVILKEYLSRKHICKSKFVMFILIAGPYRTLEFAVHSKKKEENDNLENDFHSQKYF